VDRRPTRWDRAWNAWEWNDFGTDEFLRFCRIVGCEPYICANTGEGQAREAAAWVEYCNGSRDSRWGKVRADNGHPEPYNVRLWGLGNEMYGNWQLGHLDATNYALKAVEMARAMRAVDPSIRLVGVGVDGGGWGDWNRHVTRIAGHEIDYLAPHYYCGLDSHGDPILNYAACLGGAAGVEGMLRETARIVDENSPDGKHIPLCFDEWNVWLSESNNDSSYEGYYALRDGLFAATIFNELTRLGREVPIANLAQLVNVLGAIRTNKTQLIRTPLWLAFDAYVHHSGELAVPTVVECGQLNLPGAGALPYLDVATSLSGDRSRAFVAVINRHPLEAVTARLAMQGFPAGPEVTVVQMAAESYEDRNTFEQPHAVKLTERKVSRDEALAYAFPPHSVTILVLQRA
jgi:alpha-N-arabinofuranosidase